MIENKNKISVYQLFCLLILTRLSTEVVFPNRVTSNSIESIAAMLLSEVIQIVLAIPVIVYSFKGEDFYRAIYRKNTFFGWIFGIGAALILLGASVMTVFYSSDFVVKNLFIGGSMWIIFVISAGFAVYSAVMGTEALARAGAMFLVAGVVVTVTVILADIPYMRTSGLVVSGEWNGFIGETISGMSRGGDYLIFAALLPYVDKKKSGSVGKCGLLFGLFAAVFTTLLSVVSALVLRELFGFTEYPFIAAASLSDIAFFKRLDGITAAVWTLCAVFRAGVMLLSAKKVLNKVFAASVTRRKEKAQ